VYILYSKSCSSSIGGVYIYIYSNEETSRLLSGLLLLWLRILLLLLLLLLLPLLPGLVSYTLVQVGLCAQYKTTTTCYIFFFFFCFASRACSSLPAVFRRYKFLKVLRAKRTQCHTVIWRCTKLTAMLVVVVVVGGTPCNLSTFVETPLYIVIVKWRRTTLRHYHFGLYGMAICSRNR